MKRSKIVLIATKELKESFNSPMPYLFLVVFFLLTGWFWSTSLFLNGQATLGEFFDPLPLLLVFFLPAFCMRLFSEEYKTGTMEVLATLPIRDVDIVLGKFAAALAVWGGMLILSLFNLAILFLLGSPDLGQSLATYLGAFLLGGFYTAAGLFASSLTRSQVVSFILGFIFCFVFFLAGKITPYMSGPMVGLLTFLGVDSHFESFLRGILDTRDILFFLCGQALFLAATLASFHTRRWR